MKALNLPASYYFIWLFFKLPILVIFGIFLFPFIENKLDQNKFSKIILISVVIDIWEKTVLDKLSKSGAEIIIAINASPFTISKSSERNHIALSRVKETKLPLIYLNRTGGQDELIFDGTSFALNNDGNKFFCSIRI